MMEAWSVVEGRGGKADRLKKPLQGKINRTWGLTEWKEEGDPPLKAPPPKAPKVQLERVLCWESQD